MSTPPLASLTILRPVHKSMDSGISSSSRSETPFSEIPFSPTSGTPSSPTTRKSSNRFVVIPLSPKTPIDRASPQTPVYRVANSPNNTQQQGSYKRVDLATPHHNFSPEEDLRLEQGKTPFEYIQFPVGSTQSPHYTDSDRLKSRSPSPTHAIAFLEKMTKKTLEQAQHELDIIKFCHENKIPHIVEITSETFDDMKETLCIVMPRYTPITKIYSLDPETIKETLLKICQSVAAMHKIDISHHDLKPDNILLDRKTKFPVIIDFGCATKTMQDGRACPETVRITGLHTTPAYSPPGPPGMPKQRDVFSLGATFFEILTNGKKLLEELINGPNPEINNLLRYRIKTTDSDISGVVQGNIQDKNTQSLLLDMLKKDHQERATMDQVLKHPYFSKEEPGKD